jgi:hypothetical protein
MKTSVTANHDLAPSVTFRLQEDRIHVDRWLDPAGLGLNRLGATNLPSDSADGRVVRHVLGFERRDPDAPACQESAKSRHDDAFANVGCRSHHHQAVSFHATESGRIR